MNAKYYCTPLYFCYLSPSCARPTYFNDIPYKPVQWKLYLNLYMNIIFVD